MEKIAIFDFCDTLYHGQSFDHFILYLYQNFEVPFVKKKIVILSNLFTKNTLNRKNNLLSPFKNLSKEKFEEIFLQFYNKKIKIGFNAKIIKLLLQHKSNNYKILIASGGLYEYLKYLKNDIPVDYLIATKLYFKHNLFTGKILNKECLGKNKMDMIKNNIDFSIYNMNASYVYTDHFSDLNLLRLVGHPMIVGKNDKKPTWAPKNYQYIKNNYTI